MVRLKIVDTKGKTIKLVEPEELTATGITQIIFECDQLKAKLEELYYEINEEGDSE